MMKPIAARKAETTSLERRVLAHERILQALIAHLAELDPKILQRLESQFSDPIGVARSEHDFTNTDAFADAFIRSVIAAGEPAPDAVSNPLSDDDGVAIPGFPTASTKSDEAELLATHPLGSDAVAIRYRSGVWEVRIGDRFHGDYLSSEQAVEASKQAIQLLQNNGWPQLAGSV